MPRLPLPSIRQAAAVLAAAPTAALLAACADIAPEAPDGSTGTGVVSADRIPAFRAAPEPLEEVKVAVSPACLTIGQPDEGATPEYPAAAAKVRQEGWVRLRFDLDAGRVVNPQVMASSPAGLFDEAVLAWARRLHYPSGASATSCVMEYEYRLQVRGPGGAVDASAAASGPSS